MGVFGRAWLSMHRTYTRTYIPNQFTYVDGPPEVPDGPADVFLRELDLPPVEEGVAVAVRCGRTIDVYVRMLIRQWG